MLRLLLLTLFLMACAPLPLAKIPASSERLLSERRPDTDLRVLSWNVSRDAYYEQIDAFRRVLAMVDADVLIFDELPTNSSAQRLSESLKGLGDPSKPWQVIHGSSGGRELSAIATQRQLTRAAQFDQKGYPPRLQAAWLAAVAPQAKTRLTQSLSTGIPMVGARIAWDGRSLLAVGLDFQCCGNGGDSWEESRRRYEASQLRTALIEAIAATQPDGIVVAGDFNAVNGPAPLLIAQGEPPDPAHLTMVEATQLDGLDRWTWDGRGTPFASGRLDYQLHDQQLRVVDALVLDLDDLSEQQRQQAAVDGLAMSTLSQHRPVIVDYAWRR